MANGENLDYIAKRKLGRELLEAIGAQYIAVTTSIVPTYLSRTESYFDRICVKVSDTVPGNRAEDYPRAAGDVCIHYSAAGVLQAAYVATGLTIDTTGAISAVTWTKIAITAAE